MPQTSTDWVFWAFSTILVGFLLNVAAGLAANPISEALARRRSKKTVPVLPSREPSLANREHTISALSQEIDDFWTAIDLPIDLHGSFIDIPGSSPDNFFPNYERNAWLATNVLLVIALAATWFTAYSGASIAIFAIGLFVATTLLVISFVLLVRYIHRLMNYKKLREQFLARLGYK